jgi:hypothetical protein
MSKAFIDRTQQNNFSNNQSDTLQKKIDTESQLRWVNNQKVDQGFGVFNNNATGSKVDQKFAKDAEEEPDGGKVKLLKYLLRNRVFNGIELGGYVSVFHFADGTTISVEIYKMSKKEVKEIGGTPAGIHNSVPYVKNEGIVHYYYNAKGEKIKTYWEQKQTNNMESELEFHGLYSGPGCITNDGKPGSENYNFDMQPIDWADAIAKRHDMDYAKNASDNYAGYLEDIRTLQADKDMVKRIDNLVQSNTFLNPLKKTKKIEGVDTPVRTSYSTEADFTLLGQRILINALATYKQWKVNNELGNKDEYKNNRAAFMKAHPVACKIIDQIL